MIDRDAQVFAPPDKAALCDKDLVGFPAPCPKQTSPGLQGNRALLNWIGVHHQHLGEVIEPVPRGGIQTTVQVCLQLPGNAKL